LAVTLACASGGVVGSSTLTETLSNTSTAFAGDWVGSEILTTTPGTAGAVDTRKGSAGTGQSSQIARQRFPASGAVSRPSDFVTMLWLDSSQSVQATYQATAAATQCDVVINWTRRPSA
jgi:hypothetical protein